MGDDSYRAPRHLIRDRDGAFGEVFKHRLHAMGIRDRPTAPRSLRDYAGYYNRRRTHLPLNKDAPLGRPVQSHGVLHRLPHFGGLHPFIRADVVLGRDS
jgi:hypothetical protein